MPKINITLTDEECSIVLHALNRAVSRFESEARFYPERSATCKDRANRARKLHGKMLEAAND